MRTAMYVPRPPGLVSWSLAPRPSYSASCSIWVTYYYMARKRFFRKTIISAQNKFNRSEVVLMMPSNNFFKTSTHSKMTKTPNFHASYLCLHPHNRPLVLNIVSHSWVSFPYTKQSMSECTQRVHSGLVSEQFSPRQSWVLCSYMACYGVYHAYSAYSSNVVSCKSFVHSYPTLGTQFIVILHHTGPAQSDYNVMYFYLCRTSIVLLTIVTYEYEW